MKKRPFLCVRTVQAAAAAAAISAVSVNAWALGLGRLNVQSALGEGLRAEIDISSLAPDEASTLVVRIATPEAYRAAGVDYNAVLATTQAQLARRADGRPYLRVVSDRAVQEPFIEVILELTWASGRLVREFTLLFDPPASRVAPPVQAAAPLPPQVAAAPAAAPMAPPPRPAAAPAPAISPAPATTPTPAPRPAARPTPAPAVAAATPVAPAPRPAATSGGGGEYRVRPGDTLSQIAGRTQPPGVSLDQMLVGLYRSNPEAFIGDNMNRLRAGAVLAIPSGESVAAIAQPEARRVILAQSADFDAFRQRLAEGAPPARTDEPTRQAQGKVQAEVDDKKQAAAPSADKLKLSGAAVKASAPEAQLSKAAERQAEDARVAELTRNVEELKRVQQGAAATSAPPSATTPAAAPAAPSLPAPAPAPAASEVGPAVAVVPAPIVPASRPQPPAAKPVAPADEPSVVDALMDSPMLLPGAGVLALLLAGFAAYRLRGRSRKDSSETSFLESRMQPDSFFGASGGQRIDTRDAAQGSTSMGYSLSQLDAIGDVDPVAEADVYLAYGRDLQAEEILKEAMRTNPERLAIRAKLLEVYAKRRDTKGYELLATQLYSLTKGSGAEWDKAQEQGRQIDPENPLYAPGGHPQEVMRNGQRVVVEPLGATTLPQSVLPQVSVYPPEPTDAAPLQGGSPALDLDLDLDLGLDQGGATTSPGEMETTQAMMPTAAAPIDGAMVDFDISDFGQDELPPAPAPAHENSLDFDTFALSDPAPLSETVSTASGELVDLEADDADPMLRKLELADEFRQIGDLEGARDLLEEVVNKSTGAVKAKAQAMLDNLA